MKAKKPILSSLQVGPNGLVIVRFGESYPVDSISKKGSSTDFVFSHRQGVRKH